MKAFVLAVIMVCVTAAPQRLVIPRLPLNILLRGNLPLIDPTIVGGVQASPGEFPFQVSLQVGSLMGSVHICGGSVYNENWVITACHCVYQSFFEDLIVVAGEHDLAFDDGIEQRREVKVVVMHPEFDENTFANDIALLEVTTPFDLSGDPVKAIALPLQGQETEAGSVATVTGWGALHPSESSLPDILHKVNVPIVSDQQCRYAYGLNDILDSMICAGRDEGGVDSCQGDSGGPLFIGNTIIGIVSWGYGCAAAGYPGVYTEVSYFVDWVNAQVGA